MKGIFGDLFDFNHDGKMSPLESAAEMEAIHQMMDEDGLDSDDYKLEVAGITELDLDLMDDDERAEALEDAGIDPDEFDY